MATSTNQPDFYTRCTRFLHATRNASRVLCARCTSCLIAASLVRKPKKPVGTAQRSALTPCSVHENPCTTHRCPCVMSLQNGLKRGDRLETQLFVGVSCGAAKKKAARGCHIQLSLKKHQRGRTTQVFVDQSPMLLLERGAVL